MLAGGKARRFGGRPKGLERLGSGRIVDHVVRVLAAATGSVPVLISSSPEAADWCPDLNTVPDERAGCGTLGGLFTALGLEASPVLCVAWDMPFVSAGLLQALVHRFPGHDAFLPESRGPRGLEPLCAVYGSRCRPAIAARLDRGDLRAVAFHRDVRVGRLPLDEVERYGDPDVLFLNVNTPEDLDRAKSLWRKREQSQS